MLFGMAKVKALEVTPCSRSVENHRSKTPSPTSTCKADEIWVHRVSNSPAEGELFTSEAEASAREGDALRLERRGGVVVVRGAELGEAERGINSFC